MSPNSFGKENAFKGIILENLMSIIVNGIIIFPKSVAY